MCWVSLSGVSGHVCCCRGFQPGSCLQSACHCEGDLDSCCTMLCCVRIMNYASHLAFYLGTVTDAAKHMRLPSTLAGHLLVGITCSRTRLCRSAAAPADACRLAGLAAHACSLTSVAVSVSPCSATNLQINSKQHAHTHYSSCADAVALSPQTKFIGIGRQIARESGIRLLSCIACISMH